MKIVFYCGNSMEDWSPKSVETGIGGSEEAVIELAKCLKELGHTVTVYNRCGDEEGDHNGVKYENYEYYDDPECDVLIYWRNPELIEKYKRGKAKKVYLWLHDVVPEYEVLPIKHFVDGIFVLSQYHATYLPHLKDKIYVTQNGINLDDFDQKVKRIPHKIVYGSSYDRGLIDLLRMWPEIKLAVPEATLTVFYGRNGLEKGKFTDFLEELDYLLKQEGVEELGRLSHKEVAKQYLSASIWAYPTWFPEISCITALKAQAGGAFPVITPTAALQETVKWGFTTREPRNDKGSIPWGTPMPEKLMDDYTSLIIKALTSIVPLATREAMIYDIKRANSWMIVAMTWEKLFKGEK